MGRYWGKKDRGGRGSGCGFGRRVTKAGRVQKTWDRKTTPEFLKEIRAPGFLEKLAWKPIPHPRFLHPSGLSNSNQPANQPAAPPASVFFPGKVF